MLSPMSRAIGVDYGAKRVGVAVSDDMLRFAFAKTILTNDDTLLDALAKLAEEEHASFFVVGESDNPAGGENTIMRRISIFSRALGIRTDLPVEHMSEVYTSAEARRALEQKVKNRKDKKVPVDSAAAAIILQSYLDTHTQPE